MDVTEPIILGIIQGITEWLPISSKSITSFILIKFFNKSFSEALSLSIFLHIGTLLAAIIYFKKDLIQVIRKPNETTLFLLIATFISSIIGFPLLLLNFKLNFPIKIATLLIGIFLIVTGLMQKFVKKNKVEDKKPTIKDAILLGLVQSFSIIPGLSRSGLTTSALLFRNYSAGQALKLSFLMSIPAVFAAQVALKLLDKLSFDLSSLIAILISFVFGLLTIHLLLRLTKKINFSYFCFFLSLLIFVSLLF